MPTAKKTTPKAKPKGKPKLKAKAKTAAKKVPATKKPAPASKALTDLKARLAAIEAKIAKSDNFDKIKALEEKITVNNAEVQKSITTARGGGLKGCPVRYHIAVCSLLQA